MYELPFGQGREVGCDWNGVTNAFLGGWQTNLIFTATERHAVRRDLNGGNPDVAS